MPDDFENLIHWFDTEEPEMIEDREWRTASSVTGIKFGSEGGWAYPESQQFPIRFDPDQNGLTVPKDLFVSVWGNFSQRQYANCDLTYQDIYIQIDNVWIQITGNDLLADTSPCSFSINQGTTDEWIFSIYQLNNYYSIFKHDTANGDKIGIIPFVDSVKSIIEVHDDWIVDHVVVPPTTPIIDPSDLSG